MNTRERSIQLEPYLDVPQAPPKKRRRSPLRGRRRRDAILDSQPAIRFGTNDVRHVSDEMVTHIINTREVSAEQRIIMLAAASTGKFLFPHIRTLAYRLSLSQRRI